MRQKKTERERERIRFAVVSDLSFRETMKRKHEKKSLTLGQQRINKRTRRCASSNDQVVAIEDFFFCLCYCRHAGLALFFAC
jgi:hypothetical protein